MEAIGLLSLTDDVLEAVLLKLPCKDRARCALVCRRMAHLTSNSQRLWRELEVEGCVEDPRAGPLAHLVPFLASHPRGVQRLSLKWGWGDAQVVGALESTMAALAGATALAGGTLRCLEVEMIDDQSNSVFPAVGVFQWAAALRQLCGLRLVWDGHVLSRHLGTLSQLKGLHVTTNNYAFEDIGVMVVLDPGCLPPNLEHLWLWRANIKCWPDALFNAARSLRQLNLRDVRFHEPQDLPYPEGLGHLTWLTRLILHAWPLPLPLLQQLPVLSALQELSLEGAGFGGAVDRAELMWPVAEAPAPWAVPAPRAAFASHFE